MVGHVSVPAPSVTSVAFGGPDFSDLYITTTVKKMSKEQLEKQPLSGSVFR